MKQIRTVRRSFNTTGTENYRVQLAVPPSTNNNHNHNIVFSKKLTNKYTKNYEFSTRVGMIVDRKKVLKLVHNIKSIKTVVSLLCFPYQKTKCTVGIQQFTCCALLQLVSVLFFDLLWSLL